MEQEPVPLPALKKFVEAVFAQLAAALEAVDHTGCWPWPQMDWLAERLVPVQQVVVPTWALALVSLVVHPMLGLMVPVSAPEVLPSSILMLVVQVVRPMRRIAQRLVVLLQVELVAVPMPEVPVAAPVVDPNRGSKVVDRQFAVRAYSMYSILEPPFELVPEH